MIEAIDKLRCIEREIKRREATYPTWATVPIKKAEDREIAILKAIVADYKQNMTSCA